MARAPIEIAIASETRAFRQGVESGIITPLEDAEKQLDELGRSRGPDQLEEGIRDAQRRTKELGDETKDTARDIERAYRESYREASQSADDATGRVKAGAQELQNEFGSNLGEAVSSFRGDLSDLGQTGQDTLGGLAATVSGMGPLGLAGAFALAAGAAGLGLFTAAQDEAKEKQEELNAAAAEWAGAYVDSAGKIVDAAYTVAEINAIATDPEKYQQASDNAKNWGVDVSTAMRAMAGDATALEIAQRSLNDRTAESERLLREQEVQVDENAGAAYDLAESVKAGRSAFDELNGAMTEGQTRAQNAAGALYDYVTSAGVATGKTDDLGNAIYQLPDGKEVVVDAKTKTAHENIDALEQRDIANKTIKVDADTSAADAKVWALQDRAARTVTMSIAARPSMQIQQLLGGG